MFDGEPPSTHVGDPLPDLGATFQSLELRCATVRAQQDGREHMQSKTQELGTQSKLRERTCVANCTRKPPPPPSKLQERIRAAGDARENGSKFARENTLTKLRKRTRAANGLGRGGAPFG